MSAQQDAEFREFMHARWTVVVRLAYGLTGDQGHAEDVAQAAFAQVYASWPRVSRAGDPDAYVRQVVVSGYRNRFRKRGLTGRLVDSPPGAAAAEEHDDRSALVGALQRLGPRQRAVIVLRYWLDLTEAEAALALNCTVGTVRSQASRALAALRQGTELVNGGSRDRR